MNSRSNVVSISTLGLACGGGAAILYTVANICLRSLVEVDPVWVSTIKTMPTLIFVGPVVLARMAQGKSNWSSRSDVLWLITTGLCAQIFGNVTFQWSLSILGLAISVPMVLGTMLVGGAIVGKLLLNEPVRRRTVVAVVVLIAATIVLTHGAQSGASIAPDAPSWMVVLAVVGNVGAGIAFAFLGAMMRKSMQAGMPLASTLFIISLTGTVLLGSYSVGVLGLQHLAATQWSNLTTMFAAGAFNAMAFLMLAKSLQQIPVLYVQMLNATQAALAVAFGWLLFGEKLSVYIQIGFLLTVTGLIIAGTRSAKTKPSPTQ